MRKKSEEEFGFLVTREILGVIKGKKLSDKELGRVIRYIFNEEVTSTGNNIIDAFAEPLRDGFKKVNEKRMEEIHASRERKKAYAQRRNNEFIDGNNTPIDDDRHLSTSIDNDRRPFPYKAEQSKADIYISPYNPPKGDEVDDFMLDGVEVECYGSPRRGAARDDGEGGAARDDGEGVAKKEPPAIDTAEMTIAGYVVNTMADIQRTQAYQHMRVNPTKLKRCLAEIFKKKCGADYEKAEKLYFDIMGGLEKWEPYWASQGWQYAPRKITTWLKDEKYLEPVRGQADDRGEPSEGLGCGDTTVQIV